MRPRSPPPPALAAGLLLLCAAASVRLAAAQGDAAYTKAEEVFAHNRNCYATGLKPSKPSALTMCYKFNDNACCTPSFDQEYTELLVSLFNTGLSCRPRDDLRRHPLAKLYCLPCDPKQPTYVRNVPRTVTNSVGRTVNYEQEILVCHDWAKKQIGDMHQWNSCGFLVSSPCEDGQGEIIPNRDRYVCGDDTVVPSAAVPYNGTDDTSRIESWERFLNYPDLGTPDFQSFYFKVVREEKCTDPEVNLENDPDCLMTQAQLQAKIGDFQDAGYSGAFLADESCFNSAHRATAALSLALALLLAVLLW